MEELSLDLIFHNIYGKISKVLVNKSLKLRIHSRLDRNQSKLSVCTGYSAYNAMSTYRNAHKKERHIVILGFLCRFQKKTAEKLLPWQKKVLLLCSFSKNCYWVGTVQCRIFFWIYIEMGIKMCHSFYVHFGRHHMLS